jgi:DUF1680 family protein
MRKTFVERMQSRRQFLASGAALATAAKAQHTPVSPIRLRATPFPMTQVRLTASPFQEAQEADRSVLRGLPADRLLHNFRVNAGLRSPAEPLGGWERPACELRGHFTGHFLSACALMYAGAGDTALKDKAGYLVAELAKCQKALGDGYLSAFPLEYWDRLKSGQKVWAPFYTLHKIMAGLLDVHQHCGNAEALAVVKGAADWVDRWTEPIPYAHMQQVLQVEFGGMAEVLHNLAGVTGDMHYAEVGARFHHAAVFDPLALRRDALKGLHANTNVPKMIGCARRYELTGEMRYHDIADFFWYEVTTARTYCSGGTSNDEHWKTDPRRIAEELALSEQTNECCVAYNMLKLTRHLYQWTGSPAYFDYYERTLFNHRLGTIEPKTGATMYFLPLRAGGWKIFNSKYDSFWCCTGTGVEEYAKLNDSIYFASPADGGIFVNLFIPSEVHAPERRVRLRQTTRFPEEGGTTLTMEEAPSREICVRVRVPAWAKDGVTAKLNGRVLEGGAAADGYLAVKRIWKRGDRLEVRMPMSFYTEATPDDPTLVALYHGPLVMAAELGGENLNRYQENQRLKQPILDTPALPDPARLKPISGQPLRFHNAGRSFAPLYQVMDQRYAVYFRSPRPV